MTDSIDEGNRVEPAKPAGAIAERRSFIPVGDQTGTEDIGANDIRLPRLAIAQGLSPQMIPGDSQYIEGLKMFEFFNDLNGDRYGQGPLFFIPIRRDIRRIEFAPRVKGQAGGGGVVDMDVPPNDPRNLWTTDADGKRVPPRATKFHEFVVLMLRPDGMPEMIVLSIKDTNKHNRRAAERLTSFIKQQAMRGKQAAPIYGCQYSVESKAEKFPEGTAGVPVIQQAGRLDDPSQSDEDWAKSAKLFEYAAGMAASLAGKTIVINREPGGDDDDFDPAAMEAEGTTKM